MSPLGIVYIVAASLLAVYAFNTLILSILFLNYRSQPQPRPELNRYPKVTVQLPIFNEALVIDRLIEAAVRLDWPRDRLQIQILDDSTDETTTICQDYVNRYQAQGVDVQLLHRVDRSGYKAGALKAAMEEATGEFIAIFDADFVPRPDWLKETVPYFLEQDRLGLLQTRWAHLNRDYSLLTRAQAIALDGHFVVEQTARHRSGLLMNFNGTAGIWRRDCIVQSGGWQTDTICEDLDLSYRAQLDGWQCLFLPNVTTPAEIPPQLAAFKRQQFRWAKGSIQCLKKMAIPVVTAKLPLAVRWQGLVHLSAYMIHPVALLSLLIILPLMLAAQSKLVSFGFLSLLSVGPPLMYALSQRHLYGRNWLKRYMYMPVLVLLGTGIALNNTKAVFEALFNISNVFQRTPKFRIEKQGDHWIGSQYSLPFDGMILAELAVTAYAIAAVVVAFLTGHAHIVPFLMLYVCAFGYVALQGLWESRYDVLRRLRPRRGATLPPQPVVSSSPSQPKGTRARRRVVGYRRQISHSSQR